MTRKQGAKAKLSCPMERESNHTSVTTGIYAKKLIKFVTRGILPQSKALFGQPSQSYVLFYYTIHSDEDEDDERKMPHGTADLAASCVYASVLEFEERVGFKTVCTLPAIQESAQSSRDVKSNRRTRDVTDVKIIRYTNMLKNAGDLWSEGPAHWRRNTAIPPKVVGATTLEDGALQ